MRRAATSMHSAGVGCWSSGYGVVPGGYLSLFFFLGEALVLAFLLLDLGFFMGGGLASERGEREERGGRSRSSSASSSSAGGVIRFPLELLRLVLWGGAAGGLFEAFCSELLLASFVEGFPYTVLTLEFDIFIV